MVDRLLDHKRERIRQEQAEIEQIEDAAMLEEMAKDVKTCSEHQAAVLRLQRHNLTYLDNEALEKYDQTLKASLEKTEKEQEKRRKKRKKMLSVGGCTALATAVLGVISYYVFREKPQELTISEIVSYDRIQQLQNNQRYLEEAPLIELEKQLYFTANTDCLAGINVQEFLAFYESATGNEFPVKLNQISKVSFEVQKGVKGIEVDGHSNYKLRLSPETAEELLQNVENTDPCKVDLE